MNATQDDNRRTQRSHAISWLDSSVTRRSFLQTTSKLLAGAAVAPAFFRVNEVNQVIFSPGRNQQAAFTDLFWRKVFGTVNSKIDHSSICEESRHVAHDLFSGSGIQGSKNFTEPDLASGQFVLWFGSDPCSANFPFTAIARKTIDFVQRGGNLYVVDPRCNVAASKGTWIPIKVGTDAALALAIGRYLVDNKLYNEAFLRRPHDAAANPTGELNVTDATLLVKIVDGPPVAFLRADAAGFASGTKDEFVVSAYGGVAKHNAVDAADLLSGPVVVNGITCKTAFELYVERVREKTVEEYAAICGVDVATIQKLATELATAGRRGCVTMYRGSVQHTNGTYAALAILDLNLLAGNPNWKGGTAFGGGGWADSYQGAPFDPGAVPGGGVTAGGVQITRAGSKYEDSAELKVKGDGTAVRPPQCLGLLAKTHHQSRDPGQRAWARLRARAGRAVRGLHTSLRGGEAATAFWRAAVLLLRETRLHA